MTSCMLLFIVLREVFGMGKLLEGKIGGGLWGVVGGSGCGRGGQWGVVRGGTTG